MGTDIYYRARDLTRAALFVRQNGPPYLKYLPISAIWSMLQNFVSDNFWYLCDDVFLKRFDGTYAKRVSAGAKAQLAEALAASEIFQPRNELTLFPLVPVQVEFDFDSEPFFLVTPRSLANARLPSNVDLRYIASDRFPPISEWKGRTEMPGAWLGVRSPAPHASKKMKAAILGALALTPLPRYRYSFSERSMFGGSCTIGNDGISTSLRQEPHTPSMMHDIIVSEGDHAWLTLLAAKFTSNERAVRRQLHALEYFYRAWETEPSERFPVLCMALDGIFGDANHATQAVIEGVREVLGPNIREPRLRQLMDLRAAVIHGGAPDVYDSRKYARYFDDYEADPIHDMELVVANCLRAKIFGAALTEHSDPNAAVIADAQAKGFLPKNLSRRTILEDDPTATPA